MAEKKKTEPQEPSRAPVAKVKVLRLDGTSIEGSGMWAPIADRFAWEMESGDVWTTRLSTRQQLFLFWRLLGRAGVERREFREFAGDVQDVSIEVLAEEDTPANPTELASVRELST